MGKLRQPDLAPGNLRDLIRQLHELHGRAGWPSVRDMARNQTFSYNTVHELFTKPTIGAPRLPVLMAVVEMLAKSAPRTDVEATLDDFDQMWRNAAAAPFLVDDTSDEGEQLRKSLTMVTDSLGRVDRATSSDKPGPSTGSPEPPLPISLPTGLCTPERVKVLKEILVNHPGASEVHLNIVHGSRVTPLRLNDSLRVSRSPELFTSVRNLLGPESIGDDEPPF